MKFPEVFQKVKLTLAIVAIVVIVGALYQRCGGCNPVPAIIPKVLSSKFPDLVPKNNEIQILDSNGKLKSVPYKNAKKVKSIISIKNTPDSNGVPTPPTTLVIEKNNPGFFPELFNEPELTIKSLGGNDSNVEVLNFKQPWLEFEYNPLLGINYSRRGLEASLGMNLVRVYFIHFSASLSYSSGEIQPSLDLNTGAKIELLPYIFVGYDYGVLSSEHKISLHYCYKF